MLTATATVLGYTNTETPPFNPQPSSNGDGVAPRPSTTSLPQPTPAPMVYTPATTASPPWYESTPARIGFGVVAIGVAYGAYRVLTR